MSPVRRTSLRGALAALLLPLAPVALHACGASVARATLPQPARSLAPTPDAPFRASAPAPGPAPAFVLPAVERFTLANGLEVRLHPRPDTPTVAVAFVSRRAGADDVAVPPGLPSVTLRMLDASLRRDARGTPSALARLGATIDTDFDHDYASLSVRALPEDLPVALDALARAVTAPALEPRDFEAAVAEEGGAVLVYPGGNAGILRDVALAMHFGAGNPYAMPLFVPPQLLRTLTLDQAREYYRAHYAPAEGALVISGPVRRDALEPALAATFARWRPAAPTAPAPRITPAAPGRRRVVLLRLPGLKGARFALVLGGVAHDSRDRAALDVLAAMLGGMVSSRLNVELREQAGVTAGVYARHVAYRGDGVLLIQSDVAPAQLADTIAMVLAALERLRSEGPTDEEIDAARARVRQELVTPFGSNGRAASELAERFARGGSPDALAADAAQLDALTRDDVLRVARERLDPNRADVLAWSDLAQNHGGLDALNLGAIEVYPQ